MKLAYQGYDRGGKTVRDILEAPDVTQGLEILRRQGLFITQITRGQPGQASSAASGGGAGAGGAARFRHRGGSKGRRLRNMMMFCRQFHVLVSTGTPLVQSLHAMEKQITDLPWREVITDIRTKVEEGCSFSDALASHPEYFDSISRSMVAAGESSGNLPQMLDRLATLTRKQLQVRNKIIGAMVYPALLVTVAVGVLVVMLMMVLPRFGEMFQTMGAPLPPTTRFLLSLSAFMWSYGWLAMIALAAGGVALKIWLTTSARRVLDTVVLYIPKFNQVVKSFAIARITRVLGVLLESQLPLLEALDLVKNAAGNHHYAALIARAHEYVTKGQPISAAFADTRLVSPSVHQAILHGEQSGQISQLLLNMAEFLDDENETIVRSLTSIIEPLILIGLGLLVGFLAMSMFIPLFDLTSITQSGAH